jgi:hypothetical protein
VFDDIKPNPATRGQLGLVNAVIDVGGALVLAYEVL